MKEYPSSCLLFLLLFSFAFSVVNAREPGENSFPEPFVILPQPKMIDILQENGLNVNDLQSLVLKNGAERPIMGSMLRHLHCEDISGRGVLTLEISDNASVPDSREGYILNVQEGKASIISRSNAGLFYGCQSLHQLLEDSRDFGEEIPSCRITDYPEITYRAVQIDVKHHLDHMHSYYDIIDRLARYKINAVIFEFEDKLRYQRQPLIAAPQAISIDEMAALTKYASDRNIEISPLVQGLGHASFILKHQQYAHLRELKENRWAFCPLHEGTYQVLFDMYRDAFDATPGSRYLHIGGDEIGNIGLCPRCSPMAREQGLLSLNIYWLNRVCDFALKHNRIPIFWDDMPLKEAGVYEATSSQSISSEELDHLWDEGGEALLKTIESLPDSCVFMRWNYTTGKQPGNIKALEWYQENELDVMIATAAQSGPAALFPFDVRDGSINARGIPAIKSFVEMASGKGIDGMLCTAWDDRSLHFETLFRGYIASAQYSWSPGSLSLNEYDQTYMQKEYGITARDYGDIYLWLRKAADFWAGAFNRESDRMDIHNALLPLPGIAHFLSPEESEKIKSGNVDYTKKLITLPANENPGQWTEKYQDRLLLAEELMNEYPDISSKLDQFFCYSKRNRYHWEVFRAVNDFQITAPKLLLALQECDKNNPRQRSAGIKKVQNALEEFHQSWENLKKVYSKTRFFSYPSNYVSDRYYHFASQREDLSWMIQVEELFHRMIQEWMVENNVESESSS